MNLPSISNTAREQPRPWLEKHYEATRQRTARLVKTAVDRLVQDGQAVTLEGICQQSQQVDPQGRGVKKAGILGNAEAYAYYRQHRTSLNKTHASRRPAATNYRLPTDPHRDMGQARRRYLRERKADLVERLLSVDHAYVESQQQLARLQFELLEQQQLVRKQSEN